MFLANHMVEFVRLLHVGHAEFVESGDAENGPQLNVELVEDQFGVHFNDDNRIVVVNADGRFLAEFTVHDNYDAVNATPVFVAPNVDVETSTGKENPWDDSPCIYVVDSCAVPRK